jgi:hypothetical protein
MRIVALALAVLALAAVPASACPIGRLGAPPCKKNRRQPEVIEEAAIGYASTVRGAIPRWSYERIAAFLARGAWAPITGDRSVYRRIFEGQPMPKDIHWVKPPRIVFASAEDAADMHSNDSIVLLRRIEKHGAAILVDLDGTTFRLMACKSRPDYACLFPTMLAFDPIEPAPAAVPATSPAP